MPLELCAVRGGPGRNRKLCRTPEAHRAGRPHRLRSRAASINLIVRAVELEGVGALQLAFRAAQAKASSARIMSFGSASESPDRLRCANIRSASLAFRRAAITHTPCGLELSLEPLERALQGADALQFDLRATMS